MSAIDGATCSPGEGKQQPSETYFITSLVQANSQHKSWRERLQWVRDRILDPTFTPTQGHLATLAIYLRLLATGELVCAEDGRHFRPNHHAEAAQQIEAALERLSTPETTWVLRRIYPYLPSWAADFRRAEPLTRIRDIAHRNDIPHELKQEIKQRLQNKLHRCAGPEDLLTSAEILGRVTAPGTQYAAEFVREFQIFHGELQEFFNANALDARLRGLARTDDPADAAAVTAFLTLKDKPSFTDDQLLDLLEKLTALRQRYADKWKSVDAFRRSQIRLADIGLEDYAFSLLSDCINRLDDLSKASAWAALFRALSSALDNLRLSQIDAEECAALRGELAAWAREFAVSERFHLLRLRATLARGRRLAETYVDTINRVFPPRIETLGRALGIAEHAITVFSEGDIRGHVVFQLSKLADLGMQATRQALQLPPWEVIVPGEASGTLVRASSIAELERKEGPFLALLDTAEGDAEIPSPVKGIVLGHPMPQLSHLGVRARQAHIPFAAGEQRDQLQIYHEWLGKRMRLRVTPEGLSLREDTTAGQPRSRTPTAEATRPSISIEEVDLTQEVRVLPLDQARPETSGAKAAGAQRLLELANQSGGLFRAPRGQFLPFGLMECCLQGAGDLQREYLALQGQLANTLAGEGDNLLLRMQALIRSIPVPAAIGEAVVSFFGADARLAVRSSTNGEDLENLAGAGLYESVVNVAPTAVGPAIQEVWASLWTRRATLSRVQAGIPHERIRMAVLIQELVRPDVSFIMHTVNPQSGNRDEALVELAVGLGEILASAAFPGTPYRMSCDRKTSTGRLTGCATFSVALRPGRGGADTGVVEERLDYARVPLSLDPAFSAKLGEQLVKVADFLEEKLGRPQDVEGVWADDALHIVQARPQQGL